MKSLKEDAQHEEEEDQLLGATRLLGRNISVIDMLPLVCFVGQVPKVPQIIKATATAVDVMSE